MPTLCGLAGIEPVQTDGASLLESREREFICCGFTSPDADPEKPLRETQRMIVTKEWKYIHYPLSDGESLYNLQSDPMETDNLLATWRTQPYPFYGFLPPVSRAAILGIRAKLRESLHEWGRINGDPIYK
jgi:arylsulfatase A-like enzyme